MVKMAMAMLCLHAAFQFHESLTQWTLDILEAGEFLTLPRPLRGIRTPCSLHHGDLTLHSALSPSRRSFSS
ncbi:hypothetical protein VTN96DRAFT_8834 [Rasamsonia emersonii]